MKPVKFDGHNVVIAEGQPEYQPLPACVGDTPEVPVITCWELDHEELQHLKKTGKLWLSQLTFGGPLQPIYPSVYKAEVVEMANRMERHSREPREPLCETLKAMQDRKDGEGDRLKIKDDE